MRNFLGGITHHGEHKLLWGDLMAYRITYGSHSESLKQPSQSHTFAISVLVFVIFCASVHFFWPEGRRAFWEIISPGNGEAASEAVETFFESVKSGAPVSRSFAVFCRQIICGGFA